MLRRLRHHFESLDVLEVDTPALSRAAVSDVHIESLTVQSTLTKGPLYLHTSPEFCMKRMLADGYPDIYSIARVFRDSELGSSHQPEFTMLEWYRHDFALRDIIEDTLAAISVALNDGMLLNTVQEFDYLELFQDRLGVCPLTASIEALANIVQADKHADSGLISSLGEQRDDWLDLLLATRIAPTFANNALTVVRHYPSTQAALARICPSNEHVADRFEIFFGSLELANGYVELTDGNVQEQRFERDQRLRQQRKLPLRPQDQNLVAALHSGLPNCAGVAVGLERLQMAHMKTATIDDVIPFAFEAEHEQS